MERSPKMTAPISVFSPARSRANAWSPGTNGARAAGPRQERRPRPCGCLTGFRSRPGHSRGDAPPQRPAGGRFARPWPLRAGEAAKAALGAPVAFLRLHFAAGKKPPPRRPFAQIPPLDLGPPARRPDSGVKSPLFSPRPSSTSRRLTAGNPKPFPGPPASTRTQSRKIATTQTKEAPRPHPLPIDFFR